MPVLAAGALVSVAGLLLTLNAHGRIAERIAAMEAGFGWVELPADYTAAVAKLALDVKASVQSMKAEEKRLHDRRQSMEHRQERLISILDRNLFELTDRLNGFLRKFLYIHKQNLLHK